MVKAFKIIKGIFWVALTFAAIFIIFTSLNLFGYQMFVVKSGSMEPRIHTGSVVIDHKEDKYTADEVITFKVTNSKDTITHRIVEVDNNANGTTYQVKGDANETPDPSLVMGNNIVGKVKFTIPYLGYLIAFIRTIPGLIIFIIIPAMIIIAEEMGNIKTEIKKIREEKEKLQRATRKELKKVKKEEQKLEKWYTKHTEKIKKWMAKNTEEAKKKGGSNA